jgi:hypothetical protein
LESQLREAQSKVDAASYQLLRDLGVVSLERVGTAYGAEQWIAKLDDGSTISEPISSAIKRGYDVSDSRLKRARKAERTIVELRDTLTRAQEQSTADLERARKAEKTIDDLLEVISESLRESSLDCDEGYETRVRLAFAIDAFFDGTRRFTY